MTKIRPGGKGISVLVLDRAAIARMSMPGGKIWNWARGLGREIRLVASEQLWTGHGRDSGEMQRQLDFSITPTSTEGINVHVLSKAPHSVYYILGTAPHEIESKREITYTAGSKKGQTDRGWMRWFEIGGRQVLTQHVNHPGYEGRNFLNDAKDAVLARRGITT